MDVRIWSNTTNTERLKRLVNHGYKLMQAGGGSIQGIREQRELTWNDVNRFVIDNDTANEQLDGETEDIRVS